MAANIHSPENTVRVIYVDSGQILRELGWSKPLKLLEDVIRQFVLSLIACRINEQPEWPVP